MKKIYLNSKDNLQHLQANVSMASQLHSLYK